MAKGDNRAVVGSSGKPLPGMVLESGAKTIAKVLGKRDAPSGSHNDNQGLRTGGGVKFDVSNMVDKSIDAAVDPSRV